MSGLKVKLKKEIVRKNGTSIIVSVESIVEQNLQYRFFVSYDGSWKMLQDYSDKNTCQYDMKTENRCFIMVQGKTGESRNAFDYVERLEYIKKEDRYFIKKIDMISSKKIGNKEMMSFQEKQKRNFELFEEKMKQKSMEDILDPLKTIYNESLKEEDDKQEKDVVQDEVAKEEIVQEKIELVKHDLVKNEEPDETEVEPDEIEVIGEEEDEIEAIEEELDDEIEIVQDTSIDEDMDFKSTTFAFENSSKADEIDNYEEECDEEDNSEEDSDYIPEYEKLIKQAESVNSSEKEMPKIQNMDTKFSYKISSENRDFSINKFSNSNNSYNIGITSEENKELFKEKQPNNIIKGQFNRISNNFRELDNGSDDENLQNIKGVDTQLQHIENAQSTIEKQINDMCFEQEITMMPDAVVDLFDVNNKKEELIKYVLTAPKKDYYKGSQIVCTLLCPNPSETFVRYSLYYDDKVIIEKPYSMDKTYAFTPPYEGTYKMVFYAKKANSNREFIKVKEIYVSECLPIESIGISCDKTSIICSQEVTFMTTVVGGRKVMYEFYVYNGSEWRCVQEYNEKSYYTLTPKIAGTYKLLVLAKNTNSKNDYDEFVMCKFDVKSQYSSLTDISSLDL
ncbi:Y_Y_Y domain-containing protein [Hathewaya proteolytica DSM 3090]|uniref:Y_Y_Y domain-containing protein n=1 Tax=Hathewaya proteolytica DSM 3090 TaxID=1121331 RepID=A0A1M6NVR1_9CLOT|nr:triple tyrosine motif-containing protein [Hathewaya proteolytica]SHJ99742.1 Y_Y_Y domain-containing protein [Hathewaya proteolytica DSM 3090]